MGEIKIADIKALSVEERLELIERIWDTLVDTPEEVPVPDWHNEVLDQRLRGMSEAPDAGSPWPDVKRRVTGRP